MEDYNGDFEIVELMVVNGVNEIGVVVVTSAIFILSAAYPNPFNPSTSILWDVLDAGNVNIFVRHQFVFVLIIM